MVKGRNKGGRPKTVETGRLYFTPSAELRAALSELSEESGASVASFVAEVLEEAVPQIKQITAAVRLAKKNNVEALDLLSSALFSSVSQASQLGLEITETSRELRKSARSKGKNEDQAGNDSDPGGELGEVQG